MSHHRRRDAALAAMNEAIHRKNPTRLAESYRRFLRIAAEVGGKVRRGKATVETAKRIFTTLGMEVKL